MNRLMKLALLAAAATVVSDPPAGFGGLTYRGQINDETDLATYNGFGALDIGAASADRVVFFAVYSNAGSNTTLNSVSVNGGAQSPTKLVGQSVASSRTLEIWRVDIPTGTTCTIEPTFSASQSRCGLIWWTATSVSTVTPSDSGVTKNSSGSVTTLALDAALTIPSGGAGLAVAINTLFDETLTWSPGGGTERLDTNAGTGLRLGAYDTTVAGSTLFEATGGPTGGVWRIAALAIS